MMIFGVVLIGILVYYMFIKRDLPTQAFQSGETPELILKKRFVKGEIDEDTYLNMMNKIKG